jgi:DNA repair photolyase
MLPVAKGRGAAIQPANPYLSVACQPDWDHVAEDEDYLRDLGRPPTEYLADQSESVVTENNSPDIGFRYSLNPYRGCAHGCSYCYARPTHEFLGLSAGRDFETKVFVKHRAAELFRAWLARPSWQPEVIAFSGVTDCYQPAERQFRITRDCLAVAAEARQPIGIVTKNALVTRDLDLLAELAAHRAVRVCVSITTLDANLARLMEPRTSSPEARLRAIRQLTEAGISTQLMLAPVIPGLNDSELPGIMAAAHEAGAQGAAYTLLRLPTTVRDVFFDWLFRTYPDRYRRVEALIRATRGGRVNQWQYGLRHRGQGPVAELVARTFAVWIKKLGWDKPAPPLDCDAFRPPRSASGQMRMF